MRLHYRIDPPALSGICLDLKYPGSTFTHVLKSHGKDGRYLVLVVGPFSNLSDDFMVLCDFLGRARALKAINSWNISPKHALTMKRHSLVSHFGHLASLVWAKLILGRFRDDVLPDFLDFLLVLTITITRFSIFTVMGDIAVDMSQGQRICVRVFCLLYS
jgi:hypothetical protein